MKKKISNQWENKWTQKKKNVKGNKMMNEKKKTGREELKK